MASMTTIQVLSPHTMKIKLSDGGYILVGTGDGLRGVLEAAVDHLYEIENTAALARAEALGVADPPTSDSSESEESVIAFRREVIVLESSSSSEDDSEDDVSSENGTALDNDEDQSGPEDAAPTGIIPRIPEPTVRRSSRRRN